MNTSKNDLISASLSSKLSSSPFADESSDIDEGLLKLKMVLRRSNFAVYSLLNFSSGCTFMGSSLLTLWDLSSSFGAEDSLNARTFGVSGCLVKISSSNYIISA